MSQFLYMTSGDLEFSSVAKLCLILRYTMDCSMPGLPVHHQPLEHAQTQCPLRRRYYPTISPLLSPFLLPSVFSSIRVSSNELALHIRWPEYQSWSFSFSISPSSEYSGLISFRIGWFDLLALQGTHKSLLQHHNLKASVLWCSVFFVVQVCTPAGILRWFWFVRIFLTRVVLTVVILVDVKLGVHSNLNFYFPNDEYLILNIFLRAY